MKNNMNHRKTILTDKITGDEYIIETEGKINPLVFIVHRNKMRRVKKVIRLLHKLNIRRE